MTRVLQGLALSSHLMLSRGLLYWPPVGIDWRVSKRCRGSEEVQADTKLRVQLQPNKQLECNALLSNVY